MTNRTFAIITCAKLKATTLLFAVALCLAAPAYSHNDKAVGAQVSAAKPYQHNGLTALIAVPVEASLTQSRALPVWVQMVSFNDAPLPDEITLQASWGQWIGSNDSTLRLKLTSGMGTAVLMLVGLNDPGTEPLAVEAAPVEGGGFFGRAVVTVLQQTRISIEKFPVRLPADGKTMEILQARITDQFDKPMAGVSCFLRYQTIEKAAHRVALARSDAHGVVSFQTPLLLQEGEAYFQFDTGQIASPQFTIKFEKPVS